MVRNGAKNLIYLSRSGNASKSADDLLAELHDCGARTLVLQCDVSDEAALVATLSAAMKEMPPIRGVVQAAMVLKDQIFSNMSHAAFADCVRPKVQGSRALHNVTRNMPLDFFLLLSSCASFWGNAGQANYAAGCNYQVSLAAHRRALGLPAAVIDIGKVSNVGFVAENTGTMSERNLVKLGLVDVSENELLAMLELAIASPSSLEHLAPVYQEDMPNGHLLTGVHSTNEKELPFWSRDPVFSHMDFVRPHLKEKTGLSANAGSIKPLPELLAGSTLQAAEKHILQAFMQKMSRSLLMPLEDMKSERPTSSFGIDSLVAVELRNWIMREVQVEVPVFEILQAASLNSLASKIASKSPLIKASG